jgi:hypothetical protein
MTTLSDDIQVSIKAVTSPPIPKEWQPYAEDNGSTGRGAALLPKPWNTHNDLLLGAGFDPRSWRIAGPINTRKWMRYDQEWLHYYKFDVVAGESPELASAHIAELTKVIRGARRIPGARVPERGDGQDAWAYFASDWQTGKREGDDGTPQTVDRVLQSFDLAEAQIKRLRRGGAKMPTGMFGGLGDIGEGTCGFYPGMSFLIDADRRTQNRINRELITHGIDRLSPYFDEFLVTTVPGNHGENRSPKGERLTGVGDNDDIAVFETVKEAFDRAGSDVQWIIPDDEIAFAVTLGGVSVAMTHGNHFKGSLADLSAQKGAVEWWRGQDFGYQPIRGARCLVSGHFHHFSCNTFGSRTAFQAPPMDPGSQWVTNRNGEKAPAAVLTIRFDASEPLGFADVALLSPETAR